MTVGPKLLQTCIQFNDAADDDAQRERNFGRFFHKGNHLMLEEQVRNANHSHAVFA